MSKIGAAIIDKMEREEISTEEVMEKGLFEDENSKHQG